MNLNRQLLARQIAYIFRAGFVGSVINKFRSILAHILILLRSIYGNSASGFLEEFTLLCFPFGLAAIAAALKHHKDNNMQTKVLVNAALSFNRQSHRFMCSGTGICIHFVSGGDCDVGFGCFSTSLGTAIRNFVSVGMQFLESCSSLWFSSPH